MNAKTAYSMSLLLLMSASCEEVRLPGDPSIDSSPVIRAAKAPPIMGGTLLVTRDGVHAVVADPPRDVIHIVDLVEWKETATIELEDGALPFRGAEDRDGRVHVTLRGTGEVVTIDPESGSVTESTRVCPNPRGIAFEADTGSLHVACAGGRLVTLPESGSPTHLFVASDLRDVFIADGRVHVTRFRAAEVFAVGDDGTASLVGAPITLTRARRSHEPTTAWRTLAGPDGGWLMLHQTAANDRLPDFEEPLDPLQGEQLPSGYGGDNNGGTRADDPCRAVVNPSLSGTRDDGVVRSAGLLGSIAIAVDLAVSPDGQFAAIASPSQDTGDEALPAMSVFEVPLISMSADPDQQCEVPDAPVLRDDVVAVAYQPNGPLLALARDEPRLYRLRGFSEEVLELRGDDASDTGFDLFHNDTGAGIACVSCHPEGTEDGHTWVFEDLGPRRTQALNVGLEGTAPFHWKGDMDDVHMIARRVRQSAMGGQQQSEARQTALRDWLFSLRPPNPLRRTSDAEAMTGQRLFVDLGCATCHAGESFTSPNSVDLGHGALQTPALAGVALRPPYMHDGRARTLDDAVTDMVVSTGHAELEPAELDAVVAFLESI